jgi:hypothetical protein
MKRLHRIPSQTLLKRKSISRNRRIALAIAGACILGILMGVAVALSITLQQNNDVSNTTTAMGPASAVQGSS